MKKAIIIIGGNASQINSRIKEIALQFGETEIVRTKYLKYLCNGQPFATRNLTPTTEIFVTEQVPKNTNFDVFFYAVSCEVHVNQRGKEPYNIKPRLIFVCEEGFSKESLPTGASFERRFDIVEIN